jgi:hypothetical protein
MDELADNGVVLDNNSISLAGEFAVLSQLALRGFDANLTLGRTKSVDILISDPVRNKMFKMEVKTHYRNSPERSTLFGHTLAWVMNKKHEVIVDPTLYYCFVAIKQETHIFRFFIVPSTIVAEYVKRQHEYWLSSRKYKNVETDLRRFRIGLDKEKYKIPTPFTAVRSKCE